MTSMEPMFGTFRRLATMLGSTYTNPTNTITTSSPTTNEE